MGQVLVLLINQEIEIEGLDQHLLCPKQCHMNGILINEGHKFLALVPSETMQAIQIMNPFNSTHLITILLQLKIVTSYFDVRKPTQEKYEDPDTLKIELIAENPSWEQSSPEFSMHEQSMLNYRGWHVNHNTPLRGQ